VNSFEEPQLIESTTSRQRKDTLIATYLALVSFLTYVFVYGYRKPFSVATFDGVKFWGVSYQSLLIISQVFGYMLSKFYGIKFIGQLRRFGRWKIGLSLMGIAWAALFIFAIIPPPFGMLCLFINGFALGFMWGIVFSYVEGRRATDFIGTAMAVSFIFAGGFTRSVAKWLIVDCGVSERWMPFVAGLVFALPLVILFYLLERIPQPDKRDEEERTPRKAMTGKDRKKFLRAFGFGLAIVVITYMFLTIMRDIRDNFMSNLWSELGYSNNYSIYTLSEGLTSIVVFILVSLLVFCRRNITAFRLSHVPMFVGFLIAGGSSLMFVSSHLNGAIWMQLVGFGLYLAYIPFNCIFFERMIASFRIKGNVGFLIYFADAFGYLASVLIILMKEIVNVKFNWSYFYSNGVVIFSIIGLIGTVLSFAYFNRKYDLIRYHG
jgi:MFS family permease